MDRTIPNIFRKFIILVMLASGIGALPFALKAESLSVPPLTGRVVDLASLLSPDRQQSLTQNLALLEQQTGHQLVIVTLPDLQSYPIEEWGLQLGRQWGIGGKEKDNGIVLIVAPKDREVRIEVGYGLEGLIPDALAHAIIQKKMIPHFKQGDFAGGIEAGANLLIESLNGKGEEILEQAQTQRRGEYPWVFFVMLGIFFFMIWLSRGRYNRYGPWDRRNAGFPIIIFGPNGGRSGRGFGGGGFSGGGGSFGGGGASGRW